MKLSAEVPIPVATNVTATMWGHKSTLTALILKTGICLRASIVIVVEKQIRMKQNYEVSFIFK